MRPLGGPNQMSAAPIVGLPADTFEKSGFLFHSVGDKYLRAVAEIAKCQPLMIPSSEVINLDDVLDQLHGLVLTGAPSNVHPPHYGDQPSADHEPYDHARDMTTFQLIRKAVDRGMPFFCICRGFQELNVVLGGTLEAELQRGPGRLDHRAKPSEDVDVRYAPAHKITIAPGGFLERILGKRETIVNSIHRQGIRKLAPLLAAEAVAPDGIIEAVSVKGAKSFAFGTQWHPEYKASDNPDSLRLFTAFGDAVRAYRSSKTAQLAHQRLAASA
jgi:putative glutamine amidotransferase